MDPQKLLFEDPRIILTIRLVGFFVSELLALLSVLVYTGVITVTDARLWACWPVAIGMFAVGFLQGFWNPYTKNRVLFYVYTYCFLGIFLSIFILGFSTAIFLGWLLLIMVMDIYFSRKVAAVGMASMAIGAVGWLLLHLGNLSVDTVFNLVGNSAVVIAIVLVISAIWRLTLESIDKLKQSKVEEDLERQRLTSLVNSMADAVVALDGQGEIVLYNAAALNIFDVNTIKAGSPLANIFKPIDKNNQPFDIVAAVKRIKAPTTNRDLRLGYEDGSTINLYLSMAPVRLGYGSSGQSGYVLLLRDITREKSLEEERDEFISVVSHELRTPIAISEGNIGNAEFIAEKTGDLGAIRQALKEAHGQVLFLADMINDLSTLSRAERGKLQVEVKAINVHDLATELSNDYTPQAKEKGLEFKLDLDPKLELFYSSQLYVQEILQNFITNAIKYTETGSVTLHASAEPKGVRFAVEDTGIGISKGDQERVYDKFFRSEDFRTRKANGTGLGLYVTLKLARLVHAELSLDSQPDKGSTFSVFFPNLQ